MLWSFLSGGVEYCCQGNTFSVKAFLVLPKDKPKCVYESMYTGAVRYPAASVAFPLGRDRCETIGRGRVCGRLDHEYCTFRSPDENNSNKRVRQGARFSILTASCNTLVWVWSSIFWACAYLVRGNCGAGDPVRNLCVRFFLPAGSFPTSLSVRDYCPE